MEGYSVLGRIGEGAHGIVLKAKHLQTGEVVALKRVSLSLKKLDDGIPKQVIREVKALQLIDSDHVVKLFDVFTHGASVFLVFEFMLTDLCEVLRDFDQPLTPRHVKCYSQMLLKGLHQCHKLGIIHRDLKPANLLISANGVLKIADFGLARAVDAELADRAYSHQVATRWYRAPELLYGAKKYDEGVDLWAVGCIFGEMLNNSPIFPGDNDIDQLCIVLRTLGTPNEDTWPGMTELPDYNKIQFPTTDAMSFEDVFPDAPALAVDLARRFLIYPADKRISAYEALIHDYFFREPLACLPSQLPLPARGKSSTHAGQVPDLDVLEPIENDLVDLQ